MVGPPGSQFLLDERIRFAGFGQAGGDGLRPIQPFEGQSLHVPGGDHDSAGGDVNVLGEEVGREDGVAGAAGAGDLTDGPRNPFFTSSRWRSTSTHELAHSHSYRRGLSSLIFSSSSTVQ